MNRIRLPGPWQQWRGAMQRYWGRLTDADLAEINGSFERLAIRIQELYGLTRNEAEREIERWLRQQPAA